MRIFALLSLSFVLPLFSLSAAPLPNTESVPQSFKIWGDSGKVLTSDQKNIICEMIELEYITRPREMSIIELSIKDADGQIMAKRIISSDGGNLHSKIAVNRWPVGNYFVQVWIDGEEEAYPIEIVEPIVSEE